MENRANYALIGAFVIISLLAAVAFLAWLTNYEADQTFDNYEVVFTGPVRGLSKGSEVRYNGLRVGDVQRLRWSEEDSNTVIADIQVIEGTPIHRDSPARLEPQGLTGLNYIQVTTGPSAEAFSGRKPYQIDGSMSQFDTLLDDSGSLIEGGQKALGRINAVMSPDAIQDFHAILANLRTLSGNVKNTEIDGALVERVLRSFDKAARDVSAAAIAVDKAATEFDTITLEDSKLLMAQMGETLEELDKTLMAFTGTANSATLLTEDSRDAINRLSNSGLTDMEETADAMRRLMITLNEMMDKLEKDPRGFISGEEPTIMELPQ